MDSRRVLNTIITILLIILFFKFIGILFRFWYISLPIILAIYFYIRRRFRILAGKIYRSSSSNQDSSRADEDIVEAEYTVVEEDEEDQGA